MIKIFKCKEIFSGTKKFKFLDWTIMIPGKRTKSIFIILLPITLPIPMDPFFLTYEITTVASSGRDVPIARMDIPIIVCSNPNEVNISRELSKNTFPPMKMPKNANINLKYTKFENSFI